MKVFCKIATLATILLALQGLGSSSCQASCETICQRVDQLLALGENQQAWDLLQENTENSEDQEELLWRMARTRYEMGRLADPEEKALELFQEAEQFARAAMHAAPEKSDGYKWLAIALGGQAKYTDTETQVRQSREIKDNIEKAIALAPDDDIAYLVLSRWHYKISDLSFFARTFANIVYGGLPEASLDEAEKLLLHAIELHDRIAHRYNLAKVYDRMDRREDAEVQYGRAVLLSVTFPEEAEELEKANIKLQKWRSRSMTNHP